MKFLINAIILGVLMSAAAVPAASAQSMPAGKQNLDLTLFGGATGTNIGLASGRNGGITGGADLGMHLFASFLPSIEVRATYPFYKGDVASDKNILGGLKFERRYGRFHPYVDGLFGRAQIAYGNGGFPNPAGTFQYTRSPSNVYDAGGGVDFDINYKWGVLADVQMEHLATPVTTSGSVYSEAVTLGVVYRFHFKDAFAPRRVQ